MKNTKIKVWGFTTIKLQAKRYSLLAIIALVAVIGFSMFACDSGGGGSGGSGDPELSGEIYILAGTKNVTNVAIGTQLTAVYMGSENISFDQYIYQWNKGNTNVGTGTIYKPIEVGSYTVTVSASGYKSKTSDPVTVSVPTGPVWRAVRDFDNFTIDCIAYGNNTFIMGYDGSKIATSTDGVTWTNVSDSNNNGFSHIAYGNNIFVGVGNNGKMATSTDNGVTWTAVTTNVWNYNYNGSYDVSNIYSIAYGNNTFIAGGRRKKMATSTDGTTWKEVTLGIYIFDSDSSIDAIVYGNNMFIARGSNGKIAVSSDNGATWTLVTDSIFSKSNIGTIAYCNNAFFVEYGNSNIATSTDGMTWTDVSDTFDIFGYGGFNYIAYGNNMFVTGGSAGRTAISTDNCVTWTAVTTNVWDYYISGYSETYKADISGIVYGNGKFVAVGTCYNTGKGKMAYLSDN